MAECVDCGVGDRGAFLVEVDGERYCEDCAPAEPCERCDAETEERSITGAPRCKRCQQRQPARKRSSDRNQASLGDW